MESQPQNLEFRNYSENHIIDHDYSTRLLTHQQPIQGLGRAQTHKEAVLWCTLWTWS